MDIPNGPVLLIRKRIIFLVFKYFLVTKFRYPNTHFLTNTLYVKFILYNSGQIVIHDKIKNTFQSDPKSTYSILYWTELYCTVLNWTVMNCTVLYCIELNCTVLYCTVLNWTVMHCTVMNWTLLHCIGLNCTVLHRTTLYCIVLYCTVLYYTVLYCTVLYCTVLQCSSKWGSWDHTKGSRDVLKTILW